MPLSSISAAQIQDSNTNQPPRLTPTNGAADIETCLIGGLVGARVVGACVSRVVVVVVALVVVVMSLVVVISVVVRGSVLLVEAVVVAGFVVLARVASGGATTAGGEAMCDGCEGFEMGGVCGFWCCGVGW